MNIFPVDAVLLISKKKKKKDFQCCIPLNKFLLILISWVEVLSWRESPGGVDGFIVLMCGR